MAQPTRRDVELADLLQWSAEGMLGAGAQRGQVMIERSLRTELSMSSDGARGGLCERWGWLIGDVRVGYSYGLPTRTSRVGYSYGLPTAGDWEGVGVLAGVRCDHDASAISRTLQEVLYGGAGPEHQVHLMKTTALGQFNRRALRW